MVGVTVMVGVTSKHLTFDGVTLGHLQPLKFDRLENWLRQCQMFRSDPERPAAVNKITRTPPTGVAVFDSWI